VSFSLSGEAHPPARDIRVIDPIGCLSGSLIGSGQQLLEENPATAQIDSPLAERRVEEVRATGSGFFDAAFSAFEHAITQVRYS
jgi:hypothetical protein